MDFQSAFSYNRKVLCTSYYIKAYANFAHKFFSKTWRDEQRRGLLHEILSFAIIIMSIYKGVIRDVLIYDSRLIEEMEQYERTSRPGRAPQFGNTTGHDDLMTSAIWAFYIIKNENKVNNKQTLPL